MAAAAEWKIQVKGPDNKPHKLTIASNATLNDLKKLVSPKVGLAASQMEVLAGFPLKPLAGDSTLLSELKCKSGESFTIKKSGGAPATVVQGKSDGGPVAFSIAKDKGKFQLHQIPADGNCLFHAANLLFTPGTSEEKGVAAMRQLCSDTVAKGGSKFTTATLGTPPARYIENIKNEAVWGSVVELNIFSAHYGCELIVFDTVNLLEVVHGKGGARRAFLWYDGKHYNVITYAVSSTAKEQSVFPSRDMVAWKRARDFIEAGAGGQKPKWGPLPAAPASDAKAASATTAAAASSSGGISAADLAAIAATQQMDFDGDDTPSPASAGGRPAAAAGGGGGGKAWKCGVCTFENKAGAGKCEMCDSPK